MIKYQVRRCIKATRLWILLSHSDWYQKIKNPSNYQAHLREIEFYERLFKYLDRPVQIIFDVGANWGSKTNVFSKLAYKVVSFEPAINCFRFLEKRFRNSNVVVLNLALGNCESENEFYSVADNEGYSSLSPKHIEVTLKQRGVSSAFKINKTKVKVKEIEYFINQFGVPDYIKIDVEGFELEVIKGLKTLVPIISFEANLPQFTQESVQCIEYLMRLSKNRYRFNFINSNFFINQDFIEAKEAIQFVTTTKLTYLEIYALIR
jgi:FkbM family methyltransferase